MMIFSELILRPFPIRGQRIVFSMSTISGLVLLLSLPCFFSMSFLITSPHLSLGLTIFRCEPTFIFHVIITTSCSVFLSTWPNHLSLASLMFSLMCAKPVVALMSSFLIFSILIIPIIHLNIFISVLSSKFCSAFVSAHVSHPSIRTVLMTVWYRPTAALSIMGILLSHTIPDIARYFPIQLPCVTPSLQPPFSLIIEPRYLNVSTCYLSSHKNDFRTIPVNTVPWVL